MVSALPAATAGESPAGFDVLYLDPDSAGAVQRRGPLSVCWSTRFEDVPPIRTFPSYQGQRSFPGLYFAASTNSHVGFESWLERDNLMMLDFSREVRAFSAQPFWLLWPSEGKVRKHAPDFFVRRDDGSAVVIDVRADDRISPEDAAAFAVTKAACESVGWGYRRVGALDPVLAANVRWLAGYRHPRCLRHDYRLRLLEAFRQPAPLLAGAEEVGDRIAVLPSLFHLMWAGVLTAELAAAPLNGTSAVSVSGGNR